MKYKEPTKSEIDWLKSNIISLKTVNSGNGFDDLKPLDHIIGDSRIVSLGESTHGSKEIFQIKHRIIEYLATEKGFNIFAIEVAMPEAYKLNDYIIHGKGDPKKLILGMVLWTCSTEEVLEMVLWMRSFNESGKGLIQFTGFDMQSINGAIDNLRDFSLKNDSELIPLINEITELDKRRFAIMKAIFESSSSKNESSETDKEKLEAVKDEYITPDNISNELVIISNQIYKYISDNEGEYLKFLNKYEYNWLKQNSRIIVQYSHSSSKDFKEGNRFRDKCMAENINWILDNNPKSKIVVWAHNGHINKKNDWLGGFLMENYKDSMKVFSITTGSGKCTAYDMKKGLNSDNDLEPPILGSSEYYFEKTENPLFILDLKRATIDNIDSEWLLKDIFSRSIGAVIIKGDEFSLENISELYDAVIYIDKTISSVLLKLRMYV